MYEIMFFGTSWKGPYLLGDVLWDIPSWGLIFSSFTHVYFHLHIRIVDSRIYQRKWTQLGAGTLPLSKYPVDSSDCPVEVLVWNPSLYLYHRLYVPQFRSPLVYDRSLNFRSK